MNQLKELQALLKEALVQFWDERQGQERRYIIVGITAFVLLLIYWIGIDPAITGRQQLSKTLPTLRLQALEMQQMARELEGLPRPENLYPVTKDAIETSLSQNSLKAQSLSVVEGVVRAQLSSVAMAALQKWLLEMQKSSGLFVEEIKIVGGEQGLVNVTLVLRQAGQGG